MTHTYVQTKFDINTHENPSVTSKIEMKEARISHKFFVFYVARNR